jgi:hypothetical protein
MAELYSGREITDGDMDLIKWARSAYPNLSRSELAGTVCELIGWVTPAGGAKIQQCMDLFAKMEAEGKLDLPVIRSRKAVKQSTPHLISDTNMPEIINCGEIELSIARAGEEQRRWRTYVNSFHYLGDKTVFGSRIYYFIRSEGRDLGCLLFSAASWALADRDKWIGWTAEDRKARLFLVINNARFLILPFVRIKNLASRALSLAAKQIQSDWKREFAYSPVLLETFVDERYAGTSYTAANWTLLGHTKGRGRMDRHHNSHLSTKAIFVYPLRSDFIEVLKGDKPYK